MKKEIYHVIGVMSGTSLDGIDICYVEFKKSNKWSYRILKAITKKYPKEWEDKLKEMIGLDINLIKEIDEAYTDFLGNTIKDFIVAESINSIDAICSHGHTVFHQPNNGITLQIGNLPKIAEILENTVVCDFRVQDVLLGGQGAPLVPIGDKLLFYEYDFCVNLGGFANLSFDLNGNRIAYDICPVNIVLNNYTSKIGLPFDNKGQLAEQGSVNSSLLAELNDLAYYNEQPPKSLGFEWVLSNIFPLIDSYSLEIKDVLATFVEHIAIQIANEVNSKKNAQILFTGGGTYNSYLIERIKNYTPNKIVVPNKDLIEYKEAVIFGFLGVLRLRGESNCLSSVTGAKYDHSSGNIFLP